MSDFIVKVYMCKIKPKEFLTLLNMVNSSAQDSENLIVDFNELKNLLSTLEEKKEGNEFKRFIKNIIEKVDNRVEYVWFYL